MTKTNTIVPTEVVTEVVKILESEVTVYSDLLLASSTLLDAKTTNHIHTKRDNLLSLIRNLNSAPTELRPRYSDQSSSPMWDKRLAWKWDGWPKVEVADELRHRIAYFYKQTDGTMKFPSSAEGDLLKMVHYLMNLQDAIDQEPNTLKEP